MFWHINTPQYFFTYLNVDFYSGLSLILDIFLYRENGSFISRVRNNFEDIFKRNDVGFIEKHLEVEVFHTKMLYPAIHEC